MKNLLMMLFLVMTPAFAGNELPNNAPRPPEEETYSADDMRLIADALISRQISKQVAKFNELVNGVNEIKLTKYEDLDIIVLSGMILRIDIPCGSATLTIERTMERGFGGQPVSLYKAKLQQTGQCR